MEDESIRPDNNAKDPDLLKALWVFFSSMKTAIILLLVLAVASVIGTVIPQGGSPEMYLQQYGRGKSAVLIGLQLTDVFHSGWYGFLLGMVAANLLVCSINRLKMAWIRAFRPKVISRAEQVATMQVSDTLTFAGSAEEAEGRAASALRRSGYQASIARDEDGISVYASKGRLGIWGPYLTHLSMLVIFAGYMLGNRIGFDGFTFIPEGSKVGSYYPKGSEETRDLGFEVKLIDFTIEHDAKHNPTSYKSRLQVFDKGRKVAEKTIDVNHPLSYRGITFYQSDFGVDGLVLKVTGADKSVSRIPVRIQTGVGEFGKEYAPEIVPLPMKTGGAIFVHGFVPDYIGGAALSASDLPIHPAAQVYINTNFPEKKMDWTPLGWVTADKPVIYDGRKIELERVIDYTGLQVASNPALPVVYAGFALMLLGVFAAFYVHHRVIRVRITEAGIAIGGSSRSDTAVIERDISRVRDALASQSDKPNEL